ncbi:hypothetical protein Tco_0060532 [Tanacetum coccineum]
MVRQNRGQGNNARGASTAGNGGFQNRGGNVNPSQAKPIKFYNSNGIGDEVFSTWMAFGGNTRDLGSFGEETDKITDLHQITWRFMHTVREDGVTGIKRRRRDLYGDSVKNFMMMSGRDRLKENLESSTW